MNRSLSGLLPGRSSQPGKRVLPGFALSLGISLFFISVVLILLITGLVVHTAGMGWDQYLAVITDERVVASYKVTLWTAALASVINALVDRKSTRLNSSHVRISYAVFCLKKKNNTPHLVARS